MDNKILLIQTLIHSLCTSSKFEIFLQLIGFIKSRTQPTGDIKNRFLFSQGLTLTHWMPKELPCEAKILGKHKFRYLTSIFNFSFNHKCNLVSTNPKRCHLTLALKIFTTCFRLGRFRGNQENRVFSENSASSSKPNVHLSI